MFHKVSSQISCLFTYLCTCASCPQAPDLTSPPITLPSLTQSTQRLGNTRTRNIRRTSATIVPVGLKARRLPMMTLSCCGTWTETLKCGDTEWCGGGLGGGKNLKRGTGPHQRKKYNKTEAQLKWQPTWVEFQTLQQTTYPEQISGCQPQFYLD